MRLTESQLRKIVRQEIMREGLPSSSLMQEAQREWQLAQKLYPKLSASVGEDQFLEEFYVAEDDMLRGGGSGRIHAVDVLVRLAERMA